MLQAGVRSSMEGSSADEGRPHGDDQPQALDEDPVTRHHQHQAVGQRFTDVELVTGQCGGQHEQGQCDDHAQQRQREAEEHHRAHDDAQLLPGDAGHLPKSLF